MSSINKHEAMGAAAAPNVLILGGTGVVGRLIARDLHAHGNVRVTLAARRIDIATELPCDCDLMQFDIDEPAGEERLRVFDFVVIAAGPTTLLRARAQALCIEAGVPCLDVNDSLEAAADIIALDERAREAGVAVYTGFGLLPGLSTHLLLTLAERQAKPGSKDYRLWLYMGAKTPGGPTSSHVLSAGFRDTVTELIGGTTQSRRVHWSGPETRYAFPGIDGFCGTLAFSSPEALTLPRGSYADALRNLAVRYHVQFLPIRLARVCAKLSSYGISSGEAFLAWLFAKCAPMTARRSNSSRVTVLVATRGGKDAERVFICGDYPAPTLTAAFAGAAVLRLIQDGSKSNGGVWSYDQVHRRLPKLAGDLTRRGIVIARDEMMDGLSSPADGTASGLRHYGQCWYDVAIPKTVMTRQWRCLRDSELWKRMQQRLALASKLTFLWRFLFRWQRDYRRARRFLRDNGVTTAGKPIARDFSMFASGYGLCRSVLGRQTALKLYRAMFLETGAMELRWLWPSPEIIAAQPEAEAVFRDYINAYFRAYGSLSVYDLTFSDGALTVNSCRFAELLAILEAGELSLLVREMELDALRQRATPLGLIVDWVPREASGSGCLSINRMAEISAQ